MSYSNPNIKNYLSLVKFSHTIFALPFALIGFFLAIQTCDFNWKILVGVFLCMVFARNAAMAFNRLIDKDIDQKNPRTSQREIPAGVIKSKSALFFVLINCVLFVLTTYFINSLVFFLSPLALLVVLGYSYTKRFTWLCHFVLGLGLALAPIGAYLAVSARFDVLPLIFSFIVFFWVGGFDVIYSLQDEDFDRENQLKSIPAFMGKKNALRLSAFIHVVVVGLLIIAGIFGDFNFIYWLGAFIFSVLLLYQHLIVTIDDLSRVNIAFFTTNGFASVIFAFLTILSFYV